MVLNSRPGVKKAWDGILILLFLNSVTCVLIITIIANTCIALTS